MIVTLFVFIAGTQFALEYPQLVPKIYEVNPQERVITQEVDLTTEMIESSLPSVVAVGIKSKNGFSGSNSSEIGSGFVIENGGVVATNKHVVSQMDENYEVSGDNGHKYRVSRIWRDKNSDVAILEVPSLKQKGLRLGDEKELKLGSSVIAIGTAFGSLTNTVTRGIVSGLDREIEAKSSWENSRERLDQVIQIDAAINPGNSGGPLLNNKGEVVGINTAMLADGQNIGFALPISRLKVFLERLKNELGK
jgi:serine protease Do